LCPKFLYVLSCAQPNSNLAHVCPSTPFSSPSVYCHLGPRRNLTCRAAVYLQVGPRRAYSPGRLNPTWIGHCSPTDPHASAPPPLSMPPLCRRSPHLNSAAVVSSPPPLCHRHPRISSALPPTFAPLLHRAFEFCCRPSVLKLHSICLAARHLVPELCGLPSGAWI
jgi:hypothetical protein